MARRSNAEDEAREGTRARAGLKPVPTSHLAVQTGADSGTACGSSTRGAREGRLGRSLWGAGRTFPELDDLWGPLRVSPTGRLDTASLHQGGSTLVTKQRAPRPVFVFPIAVSQALGQASFPSDKAWGCRRSNRA